MNKITSFIFYISATILIVLVSFLTQKSKHTNFYVCLFSFMILSLIAGLRSENVGIDTYEQYISQYEAIGKSSFPFSEFRFEIGYSLFSKICYKINHNPQTLILISSFVINLCFHIFIYKNCKTPIYSILAYIFSMCYFFNMNAMRQALGYGFLLLGVPLLKKKNTSPLFILFALLAAFFHKSLILCSIFIFVPFLSPKRKNLYIIPIIICILLTILPTSIITKVISVTKYSSYIGSELDSSAVLGGLVNLLIPTALFVLSYNSIGKYEYVLFNQNIANNDYLIIQTDNKNNEFENYIASKLTKYNKNDDNLIIFPLSLTICFLVFAIKYLFLSRMLFIFITIPLLIFPNLYNKKQNYLALSIMFLYFVAIHFLRPTWYGTSFYQFGNF